MHPCRVKSQPPPKENILNISWNQGNLKSFTSSGRIKADTSNSTCRKY